MAVCIVFVIITGLYAGMVLYFRSGWIQLSRKRAVKNKIQHSSLSLVVAFRNEQHVLPLLLQSIKNQSLPDFELIMVNDHSDDDSVGLIRDAEVNFSKLKLLHLPEGKQGKKAALHYGAQAAGGEYLLFTDADCSFGSEWAAEMLNFATAAKADLVSGAVLFSENGGFWQRLLQLEFLSLIVTGAASISLNRASLCNGANLMIKRKLYLQHTENSGKNRSSGDDVFIMHNIKKHGTIAFCNDINTVGRTLPPPTLGAFLAQRVRWASKTSSYRDSDSLISASIVLLTGICLLICAVMSAFLPIYGICLILIFIVKTLADILFLQPAIRYYSLKYLYFYIVPLALVYPFYVATIGLLSLFYKPVWKNRKIQ